MSLLEEGVDGNHNIFFFCDVRRHQCIRQKIYCFVGGGNRVSERQTDLEEEGESVCNGTKFDWKGGGLHGSQTKFDWKGGGLHGS